ncbi:MAG: peptidylprolyl isomerase [Nostoc indistinguendum CM1-VF10]|nr:peptidylprolyl isomerase [Nostoc indistinguendum CM1-VF10]
MTSSMQRPTLQSLPALKLPPVPPATDADILAYLRRSFKMARVAALAERDATLLKFGERFGITVSDEELQAAADAFRHRYKLLSASETHSWLSKQKITAHDWSEGLKMEQVTKKLEEHLFGAQVDSHYLNNRDTYKRAAFSQILVSSEAEAQRLAHAIREENASFNALALEHSQGRISRANAGFVGVRFFGELRPELAQAMSEAKEGEIVGPIQTKLGYHIIRIEKWFPTELTIAQRKRMLAALLKLTMANIEITASSDGTELLADNESFMGELSEDELGQVAGGILPLGVMATAAAVASAVGAANAAAAAVDRLQE